MLKKMKVLVIAILVLATAPSLVFSFKLNAVTDPIIAGTALGTNVGYYLLKGDNAVWNNERPNINDVNSFDRLAVRPYSKTLDLTGDILQYASLLSPAVLLATQSDQWVTIGVMYAETVLMTYGLKNIIKTIVPRLRPFMYFDNPPVSYLNDGDFNRSFPSGHTSLAFAGASFASYVYSRYFPESQWRWPVVFGSVALATATATMRVLSGNHFLTDTLVGAAIGIASGLIVPMLHEEKSQSFNVAVGPNVVMAKISF